ncbi:hypothetical protein CROQUDRAFT_659718 [Cronartium quercuum f. sp. fusiforme G11]|uniref:Uncharacterized protein n=1 Tax=Cronartium quercuum f. sp. fusiforme G11 TaxID=708437 RepID=A0A9P6TBI6_9BASI|nr:hypothetical protein CROQUDRAFT_659718 [Cronartium quercuum f. sp. fusiforme G11]
MKLASKEINVNPDYYFDNLNSERFDRKRLRRCDSGFCEQSTTEDVNMGVRVIGWTQWTPISPSRHSIKRSGIALRRSHHHFPQDQLQRRMHSPCTHSSCLEIDASRLQCKNDSNRCFVKCYGHEPDRKRQLRQNLCTSGPESPDGFYNEQSLNSISIIKSSVTYNSDSPREASPPALSGSMIDFPPTSEIWLRRSSSKAEQLPKQHALGLTSAVHSTALEKFASKSVKWPLHVVEISVGKTDDSSSSMTDAGSGTIGDENYFRREFRLREPSPPAIPPPNEPDISLSSRVTRWLMTIETSQNEFELDPPRI